MRSGIDGLLAAGKIAEARRALSALSSLSHSERLAQAAVEAASGNEADAYSIACDLLTRDLTPHLMARALSIAGRVDYAKGSWVDGANRFGRARAISQSAQDKSLNAHTIAAHTEALLHFSNLDSAVTHVRALRQSCFAAGEPDVLCEYHLIVAEIESRLGRPNRARRELELAEVALSAAPNLMREARLRLVRCNTSAGVGDWTEAHDEARSAHRIASLAGASVIAELALNNLAVAQVAVGKLAEAKASLAKLMSSTRRSGQVRLTRSSVDLELAVAEGDYERANAIDEVASKLATEYHDGRNSYGHWYRLARIRFLTRAGKTLAATSQAVDSLDRIQQSADRVLLDKTRVAAALAFAARGDGPKAAELVGAVATGPLAREPELYALAEAALGNVSGLADSEAHELLARAARVLADLGNLSESFLIRKDWERRPNGGSQPLGDLSAAKSPAEAFRCAAAIFALASRPALLAQEIARIVEANGFGRATVQTGGETPRSETGSGDVESIQVGSELQRNSCCRVLVNPANNTSARITLLALKRLVANAQALHAAQLAESERSAIWPDPLPEQQLGFVCASESMLDLLRTTRRVASSSITVLITGETGTGKELLARAIHNCSPRSSSRFIPFNCTAVPRDLLDSHLFGHKRGAFTGAQEASLGVIRSAAGGTLFLDEIGEVGLDVQPKLLRFLESNEVHPLGEPAPVAVDVRVVAATNADLDRMVSEGKFREDLFYRLNVVRLTIPPLRERREEIPLLIDHFLERSLKEAGKTNVRIAESTSEFLLLYAWPGNVRELANEVRRMVALAESGAIVMPEHLSAKIAATRRTVPVSERPLEPTELVVRRDQPLSAAVEHVERALIQDALRTTANVELAARKLGLSRKGLYLKRQRLKIDD